MNTAKKKSQKIIRVTLMNWQLKKPVHFSINITITYKIVNSVRNYRKILWLTIKVLLCLARFISRFLLLFCFKRASLKCIRIYHISQFYDVTAKWIQISLPFFVLFSFLTTSFHTRHIRNFSNKISILNDAKRQMKNCSIFVFYLFPPSFEYIIQIYSSSNLLFFSTFFLVFFAVCSAPSPFYRSSPSLSLLFVFIKSCFCVISSL